MDVQKIPFEATRSFTPFFLDYIGQKESLKSFYNRFPQLQHGKDQIKEKSASFSKENRNVLVQSLQRQYESIELSSAVNDNLNALSHDKTFTITTGHQLNIFTGPLYFIYKIVTVINACKKLKETYPEYTFVPVYWMASEDHDYEEIKSFRLYGKKYSWETNQQGAVGRFNTDAFKTLLKEIPGDIKIFKDAYTENKTLASAVRAYVNSLFGDEGLVVVDGDDHELKKLFSPIMEDDLFNHTPKKHVESTDAALQNIGYKTQVFCRDINLFYLEDGLRSRLEKSGDQFKVVDSEITFSSADIKNLLEKSPEKFSPNVILRPLYQEVILPNLAYVGGPAEVIYWMQLKGVFNHYKVPFPMLMPRNFGLVMDAPAVRKFEKTGISLEDLFLDTDALFTKEVMKHASTTLELNGERKEIEKQFQIILENAIAIDKTLGPMIGAETQRAIKSLEKIEKKLLKAEKRKQADRQKQIEALKDSLFPNGSLQERTDNFLNFYQQDPEFIKKVAACFDPFDFQFNVLRYT